VVVRRAGVFGCCRPIRSKLREGIESVTSEAILGFPELGFLSLTWSRHIISFAFHSVRAFQDCIGVTQQTRDPSAFRTFSVNLCHNSVICPNPRPSLSQPLPPPLCYSLTRAACASTLLRCLIVILTVKRAFWLHLAQLGAGPLCRISV
jgi:hypothetical protein